jgi:hypothetical protein
MHRPNQAFFAAFIAGALCPALAAQDYLAIQRQVEALGSGAEVKLRMADGRKERGRIGRMDADGFDFQTGKGSPEKRYDYAKVAGVELARRVYRSTGGRDLAAAHRVAMALGPGHHVLAQVRGGKTYRGHIDSIGQTEFTLRLDHSARSMNIPFMEIEHLEQNLSLKAKIGIAAAIAGTVGFLIYWRTVIDHDE